MKKSVKKNKSSKKNTNKNLFSSRNIIIAVVIVIIAMAAFNISPPKQEEGLGQGGVEIGFPEFDTSFWEHFFSPITEFFEGEGEIVSACVYTNDNGYEVCEDLLPSRCYDLHGQGSPTVYAGVSCEVLNIDPIDQIAQDTLRDNALKRRGSGTSSVGGANLPDQIGD